MSPLLSMIVLGKFSASDDKIMRRCEREDGRRGVLLCKMSTCQENRDFQKSKSASKKSKHKAVSHSEIVLTVASV